MWSQGEERAQRCQRERDRDEPQLEKSRGGCRCTTDQGGAQEKRKPDGAGGPQMKTRECGANGLEGRDEDRGSSDMGSALVTRSPKDNPYQKVELAEGEMRGL